MSKLKQVLIIFSIITSFIAVDQVSKVWAKSHIENEPRKSYVSDTFRLEYAENSGAFLSLGSNMSDKARFIILVLSVGIILVGLLIYTILSNQTLLSLVAYSIILAGGFSNFYDRLTNNGVVIDFLNMGIKTLRTGIFNIADVYIMIGVGFLLLESIKNRDTNKK